MADPRDKQQEQHDQNGDKPERKSIRMERRAARVKFVKDGREPRKVRVSPTKEVFRGLIKHPNGGGFRSTGSIEWPYDTFTKRRIRDGDVVVVPREQNNKQEGKTVTASRSPARGGGSGQSTAQSSDGSPPSGRAPSI